MSSPKFRRNVHGPSFDSSIGFLYLDPDYDLQQAFGLISFEVTTALQGYAAARP